MLHLGNEAKLPAGDRYTPAKGRVDLGMLIDDARDGSHGDARFARDVRDRYFAAILPIPGTCHGLSTFPTDQERILKPRFIM